MSEEKTIIDHWLRKLDSPCQSRGRIYIFGAGTMGMRAYAALHRDWEILGFIDNDPDKQGSRVASIPVFSAQVLKDPKLFDGIIIASEYYGEIVKQLSCEYKIPSCKLLVPAFPKQKPFSLFKPRLSGVRNCLVSCLDAISGLNTSDSGQAIAIFAHNIRNAYSGGRYAAYMLAETACALGYHVYYITNESPDFLRRGTGFERNPRLHYRVARDFRYPRNVRFKYIVVVPRLGKWEQFYERAVECTANNAARMILLNFETPNWFNALSPEKRKHADWLPWLHVAAKSSMICSISRTGMEYAQAYYSAIDFLGLHCTWHPPINSAIADCVKAGDYKRQQTIVCITRILEGHKHKGADDLVEIISPAMSGATLQIVIGRHDENAAFSQAVEEKAKCCDVEIEWLYKISDIEKFNVLYNARALLFLSYFEGYGYPPIEALYCNTPCIAYDIPVLRETCGDRIVYVQRGDTRGVIDRIEWLLRQDPVKDDSLSEAVREKYDLQAARESLSNVFGLLECAT